MPAMGLEPIRCCHRQILSLVRLPFRHAGLFCFRIARTIDILSYHVINCKQFYFNICWYHIKNCKASCKTWKIPLSKKLEFIRVSAIFDKGIKTWKTWLQRNWTKQQKSLSNADFIRGSAIFERLFVFRTKEKFFMGYL